MPSEEAVAFLGATGKDKYPVQFGQGRCGDQHGAGMSRRHIPERSPSPVYPPPPVFSLTISSLGPQLPSFSLPHAKFLLCPSFQGWGEGAGQNP